MKSRNHDFPKIFRYLYWILFGLLLLWILILGQNSFLNTYQLKRKVDKMELDAKYLKAVNDSLAKENARLKTDPDAAEKAAREKFGLTKPDEKVFRFVPAKEEEKK